MYNCRGQGFSLTINSNRIFTDTNPGIKKNHIPIKTIFILKAKNKDHPTHLLKKTLKSETRIKHKYSSLLSFLLKCDTRQYE